MKARTAAHCAQDLLGALRGGSDEDVRQALDEIVNLSSTITPDSREVELRELLAGIAEPIGRALLGLVSARNCSSNRVSVQMLAHVAADGRLPSRA